MSGELVSHISKIDPSGEKFQQLDGMVLNYQIEYFSLSPFGLEKELVIHQVLHDNGLRNFMVEVIPNLPQSLKDTEFEREARRNNLIIVAKQIAQPKGVTQFAESLNSDIQDKVGRFMMRFGVEDPAENQRKEILEEIKQIAQSTIDEFKEDNLASWQALMESEKALNAQK